MTAIYICPYRKNKFDFHGRLAAFFLLRISREGESIVIYMDEWENQGGE